MSMVFSERTLSTNISLIWDVRRPEEAAVDEVDHSLRSCWVQLLPDNYEYLDVANHQCESEETGKINGLDDEEVVRQNRKKLKPVECIPHSDSEQDASDDEVDDPYCMRREIYHVASEDVEIGHRPNDDATFDVANTRLQILLCE